MALYVFDMDGTLTPARLPMTQKFVHKFKGFQSKHKSFIATGSDFKKVREQLAMDVIDAFTGVYHSMGNVLYANGEIVYTKEFTPSDKLLPLLEEYRKNTKYPGALFPNYIEPRIGMINFSVLGRDCPYSEREKYTAWDRENNERITIREQLATLFPDYDIAVGGSISIDITPKGYGKGQIAHHLRQNYPNEEIIFFGDKTFPGGNDFALADELNSMPNTKVVQVSGPDEVLEFLKDLL